jgi:hypothetical protein
VSVLDLLLGIRSATVIGGSRLPEVSGDDRFVPTRLLLAWHHVVKRVLVGFS